MEHSHTDDARGLEPLNRDLLFRLVGPLVAVVLAGILAAASGTASPDAPKVILEAALLTAGTAAFTAFAPWHRLPRSLQLLPPICYIVVAFLIRIAAGGDAGYGSLVLLPVVWLALYGSMSEVVVALGVIGALAVAPALVPGHDPQVWTRAFFLVGTAAILGVVIQQVFAQMRVQARQLHVMALEDGLTEVPNRRAWDDELEAALRQAAAAAEPICVAVLDLDHFKAYNDRAGHPAGDALLREIAAAWSRSLRRTDLLARIGGDEFAVLLRGCEPAAATAIVARLCGGIPGDETCSAGIARWDLRETPQALVARADAALYRAKEAGRDRIEIADGSVHAALPVHETT